MLVNTFDFNICKLKMNWCPSPTLSHIVRLRDRTVRPFCRTVAQSHKSRTFHLFEDFPGRFTSSNFQEYSMC